MIQRRTTALALFLFLLLAGTGGGAWYWLFRPGYDELCRTAARERNWNEVERLASAWVKSNPQQALGWYWLGRSHFVRGDFDEAAQAYRHVPVGGPRGVESGTALMQILFHQQHNAAEAVRFASELLEVDSRLPDPRRTRIYYGAMTLQRGALLKDIQAAIDTRVDLPDHYIFLMTLEEISFRDGDQVTARWLSKSPEDEQLRAAYNVHRAQNIRAEYISNPREMLKQEFDQARAELAELHAAGLHEPAVIQALVQFAFDDGDLEQVATLLSDLPANAADDCVLWISIGRYARQTGDLEEAERALKKSLELNPLGWKSRNEYAQLLRETGRLSEAAAMQKLASQGMELTGDIRRLDHVRDASREIMEKIAQYAIACGKFDVANGVYRRYAPGLKQGR